MNRRDFMRNSVGIAGGLFLHQQMLSAFHSFNPQKVRVGIIGFGDRGFGLAQVAGEMPEKIEITAICDILEFRLKNAASTINGKKWRTYKEYQALLSDPDIDAVIIATPIYNHFTIAKDALEAGKHIYLEKTMTFTAAEARELQKLAKQRPKQILQVGHQYRYTPLYFKVKDMIQNRALGKVTQIDCRWDRNWNWRRPVPAGYTDKQINWRMYKELSGGLAAELLSHQIDFINWAYDTQPTEIYATGGIDYFPDGRETFDNLQAVLRYKKEGMIGNFGATCANEREGYIFKLKGSKGTIELLMNEGIYYPEKQTRKEWETVDGVTGATKIEWTKEGGIPLLREKPRDGSWYALTEFHKVITEGGMPTSNVDTGAKTAICVDLINRSSYSGSVMTVDRK